jgi:hypothetical protein
MERKIEKDLDDMIIEFLNEYPFCRCFKGLRNGDKLKITRELISMKPKKGKGAFVERAEKNLGLSRHVIYLHLNKRKYHGKRQVGVVERFRKKLLAYILDLMRGEYK